MTQISELFPSRFPRLPGLAGELQEQRATGSLVRELGDNYERYHEFLAERLAAILGEYGGRPHPENYKTFESYASAWARVEEIVRAEAVLRRCRGFRRSGENLDGPQAFDSPLLDHNDRLLSVE